MSLPEDGPASTVLSLFGLDLASAVFLAVLVLLFASLGRLGVPDRVSLGLLVDDFAFWDDSRLDGPSAAGAGGV